MLRRTALIALRGVRSQWAAVNASQTRSLKQDTGIVGLAVDPNARENLKRKCQEVLETVKGVPESAHYRTVVEQHFKYRLKHVESAALDEEIEQHFNLQLEQMIRHCNDELSLIPKMIQWQPWDVPPDHTVPMVDDEEVEEFEASQKDNQKDKQ